MDMSRQSVGLVLMVVCALSCSKDEPTKTTQPDEEIAALGPDAPDAVTTDAMTTLPCPAPPAKKGQARTRTIGCAADVPNGRLAAGRVGDYVLENAMARFVVRAGAEGEAVVGVVGGNVVDAVRIGPDGKQSGVDGLREWVPVVQMFLVSPEKIETGKDGDVAFVRVTGPLVPFPTVQSFLAFTKPDADVMHEYRLAPDTAVLQIVTSVKPRKKQLDSLIIGDATFWGGAMALYRPTSGDPDSGFKPPQSVSLIGISPQRASKSMIPAAIGFQGKISTLDAGGILAFLQPPKPVPLEGSIFKRHLVVGGNNAVSLADAMATAAKLSGAKHGTLKGKVSDTWSDVRVEVLDAKKRPLTLCDVASDGAFSCPVPVAGRFARAVWLGNGASQAGGRGQHTESKPFTVSAANTATVDLQAPKPARVVVAARTTTGEKIPFQAMFIPGGTLGAIGTRHFVDTDGDATFLLPPGEWQVWIHHGPEWTAHTEKLVTTAEKSTKVAASLQHVVNTDGWVSCDTHIHAEHSSDSEVPNRERVMDAIAAGIDYAVATDHDYVTDYTPWLKDAGLAKMITVASGVEVSTTKLGHHCVWPLAPNPDKAGAGAIAWHKKDAIALAAAIRSNDPKRVHQCNHPRGSQSYFEGIKFDPATTDKSLLSFDSIEVINGSRVDDTETVLKDWFGLLDRGISPTAVGTSDAHGLKRSVGAARTLAWVGFDEAGSPRDRQGGFTAADADDAIKESKAVASTGPMLVLELLAGEVTKTIGETLTGAKGEVTARVVAQAPDWMHLGTLHLYRNGAEVMTKNLANTPTKAGLRKATVSFQAPAATKPGWWSAVLRPPAKQTLAPIQSRPPWAITNPVMETP